MSKYTAKITEEGVTFYDDKGNLVNLDPESDEAQEAYNTAKEASKKVAKKTPKKPKAKKTVISYGTKANSEGLQANDYENYLKWVRDYGSNYGMTPNLGNYGDRGVDGRIGKLTYDQYHKMNALQKAAWEYYRTHGYDNADKAKLIFGVNSAAPNLNLTNFKLGTIDPFLYYANTTNLTFGGGSNLYEARHNYFINKHTIGKLDALKRAMDWGLNTYIQNIDPNKIEDESYLESALFDIFRRAGMSKLLARKHALNKNIQADVKTKITEGNALSTTENPLYTKYLNDKNAYNAYAQLYGLPTMAKGGNLSVGKLISFIK